MSLSCYGSGKKDGAVFIAEEGEKRKGEEGGRKRLFYIIHAQILSPPRFPPLPATRNRVFGVEGFFFEWGGGSDYDTVR